MKLTESYYSALSALVDESRRTDAPLSDIVRDYIDYRAAGNVPTLLSVNADAKTSKGIGAGYLTGILYMSPSDIAAERTGLRIPNLCPSASAGCRAACLAEHSGRMVFDSAVRARVYRTLFWYLESALFRGCLNREVSALVRKAGREGLIPAVRLNGGTDILFERWYPELFAEFPMVEFYDYTKIAPHKYRRNLPANYHLTFSRSESNHSECLRYLGEGGNVAIVFDSGDGSIPDTIEGFPAISGDEDDIRLPGRDGTGVWIVLKPKGGNARRDTSGFVYRLPVA